ncbi:MAG: hypothetical protein COA38_05415 [Fluviicola sp.]|nr:MAG: hypothetical protein COA38_05415 [Fluviicola sp.]
MSLTKYYRTLGLTPGADQAAIRKAFRKLAMRYHPDKNPSAGAQAKFLIITEAYEILTGKKQAPTARGSRTRTPQPRPSHTGKPNKRADKTQAHRVHKAKERQEKQEKQEFEENERYFKQLTTGWRWKIMRWSAILGIILSMALITERFLPHHFTHDKITHYALKTGIASKGEIISTVNSEENKSYWISRISYELFGRHTRVYVRSSWIFHEPIQLISIGKVKNRSYDVHYTFFSNFGVMIFFFLLPLLTLMIKNRTIMFTIVHQTSFYGVNLLMLYFLLKNDHWAHLLTLGFF